MAKRKAIPKRGVLVSALVWAAAITVLISGAKLLVEHSDFGARVELLTYEFLQRFLANFDPRDRLPVLVVDISRIPGGKGEDDVTSRRTLMNLIAAIAAAKPRAIGVDIDFSPGENGWMSPDDDQQFLDNCLIIQTRIPIFLGTYRARRGNSDGWLGLPQYRTMAADTFIPLEGSVEVTSRMPTTWFPPTDVHPKSFLPSMGYALATSYVARNEKSRWPQPPRPLSWLLRPTAADGVSMRLDDDPEESAMLINYSKLDQLKHEAIATISPTSVNEFKSYFEDRIVILGDATRNSATDYFNPPGRGSTPGVFLHAITAYTFAIEPVYEFRFVSRLMLDGLVSLPILLMIVRRHHRFSDKATWTESDDERFERSQRTLAYWLAFAVVVVGALLVNYLAVMWLDFLFVAAALVAHPWVQARIEGIKNVHRSST